MAKIKVDNNQDGKVVNGSNVPLGSMEKAEYRNFLFLNTDLNDDSIKECYRVVKDFVTKKVDQIIMDRATSSIYKKYGVEHDVKKQYVLSCILDCNALKVMRESWITLSTIYSLLNTKLCAKRKQSELFYKTGLDAFGVVSLPQTYINEMRDELITLYESFTRLMSSVLKEKYFCYLAITGESKTRFDIYGYEEIKAFHSRILCYGCDIDNDEDLLKRFSLKETFDKKTTRDLMLSIFASEVIYTLLQDLDVMWFDLETSGRHNWLKETYDIKISSSLNRYEYYRIFINEIMKIRDLEIEKLRSKDEELDKRRNGGKSDKTTQE